MVPLSLEGRHWSAARRPKRGLEWRAAVLVEMVLASVWPKYAGHFLDDGIKMNAGLSHHG